MPVHWLEHDATDILSLPPQSHLPGIGIPLAHLPGIGIPLAADAAIFTPMSDA